MERGGLSRGQEPGEATQRGVSVGRGAGPKRRWDTEAEQILRREWGTGKPVDEIAAKLGRSVGSTRERARRLGLARPKPANVAARNEARHLTQPQQGALRKHDPIYMDAMRPKRISRPRGRSLHESERRVEPVDISGCYIARPRETLESVVNFVRSRDYEVVAAADGTLVVDGYKWFSVNAFVAWANGLRRILNKPAFTVACGDQELT